MRPLPDLSPLAPLGDIFDPVADDFTQLLSDQPQTLDQLQALLNVPADQALADVGLLSSAIDALGTFADAVDRTFTQISVETQQTDYTATIATVLAFENDFYSSLDGYTPDAQPVVDAIMNQILAWLIALIKWVWAIITAIVNQIIGFIMNYVSFGYMGGISITQEAPSF